MIFKGASAGDERAYATFKNTSGSSITLGQAVCLAIGGAASFDGTQITLVASGAASNPPGFLGIAAANIPTGQFGLIQVFGNALSVQISQMNTSITINAGDPLTPCALAGTLSSVLGAPTYAGSGFNWVICSNPPSNTISQAAPLYVSGFIRCLK